MKKIFSLVFICVFSSAYATEYQLATSPVGKVQISKLEANAKVVHKYIHHDVMGYQVQVYGQVQMGYNYTLGGFQIENVGDQSEKWTQLGNFPLYNPVYPIAIPAILKIVNAAWNTFVVGTIKDDIIGKNIKVADQVEYYLSVDTKTLEAKLVQKAFEKK